MAYADHRAAAPAPSTRQERAVVQRCKEEMITFAALPCSVFFMGTNTLLTFRGILPLSRSRATAFGRNAFLGFLGWTIGSYLYTYLYTGVVMERMKALENSPVGDWIREGEKIEARLKKFVSKFYLQWFDIAHDLV